ncbi:MAG TPA: hotdog domain-containing protein [Acidimicrobiia bacterium]|nr:hotdog domain-containing protein [Acidimicrobiia bacterium]
MALHAGLTGTASLVVGEEHLAIAVRSGDVPVFATPMIVALCEEATVAAVADHLEPGETTVGVRVELDHRAPSIEGATVTAVAVLDTVDERSLHFSVEAHDGDTLVARGAVRRVVVDRDRFVGRLGIS